jgi:hypothetical protein
MILLVGKLWEAMDVCVKLPRINGLIFGLSMMCLVYLFPSFFSAMAIKALLPKSWQKCADFARKVRIGKRGDF